MPTSSSAAIAARRRRRILATVRRRLTAPVLDAVLAGALAVGLQAEVWGASEVDYRAAVAALALFATLPLALRCRYPIPVLLAVAASAGAIRWLAPGFSNNSAFIDAASLLALYSVGANTRGRAARAGAAAVVAAVVIALAADLLAAPPPGEASGGLRLSYVAFGALFLLGPWLVGVALRLKRDAERAASAHAREVERHRDDDARAAVAAERARIARELHDVVAHAIAVVLVQARGGQRVVATDARRAGEAFTAIADTAEQALGEMRRLLGVFREIDGDAGLRAPQPSLGGLAALVDHVRTSGLAVDLAVEGEPRPLPAAVEISAYRIVQEALTNTLRHAGPARADVLVRYLDDGVEVAVSDDGGGAATNGGGAGYGLIGIRERVALVGGRFEAGPRAGGGFAVHAVLPAGGAA